MQRAPITLTLCLFVTIILQIHGLAQNSKPKSAAGDLQQAEVERVILDSAKLQNATVMVKVKAKAANVLWAHAPDRARKMMLDLLSYVEDQKDEYFDREGARNAVLEAAISRDRDFAIELLKRIPTDSKNAQAAESLRLAKLSYSFVDDETALAASILEQSMTNSIPPSAVATIGKLREKDPLLANDLVSKGVANLSSKPLPAAISGLAILSSYLYPLGVYAPPDDQTRASDERLRLLFFQTSYTLLRSVMADALNGPNAEANVGITPVVRGQLALLAATTSEMSRQYEPVRYVELSGFAGQLFRDQPATVKRLIEAQLAMINRGSSTASGKKADPEIEITGALGRGDFAGAESLINEESDPEHAKAMTQLLRRAQLKHFVAKSQLYEALGVAPKIDDLESRLSGLIDIAKAASHLKNNDLLNTALATIKALPLTEDQKGLRSRSLFRASAEIASYSLEESLALAQEGIKILNSLETMSEKERSTSRSPRDRLNDANGLVDSVDLNHAFVVLGQRELEVTFNAADKIEHPAVKLAARLAALKGAQTAKARSRVSPRAPKP
jgi:hypothetical protein